MEPVFGICHEKIITLKKIITQKIRANPRSKIRPIRVPFSRACPERLFLSCPKFPILFLLQIPTRNLFIIRNHICHDAVFFVR